MEDEEEYGKCTYASFHYIIRNCDPNQLRIFECFDHIPQNGLQSVCKSLYLLDELVLFDLEISPMTDWKHLRDLMCLSKLTVVSCNVNDHVFEMLSNSGGDGLKELRVSAYERFALPHQ